VNPPQRMQQYQSPADYYGPDGQPASSVGSGQSPPAQYVQTSPSQPVDHQASAVSYGSGTVAMHQELPTIPQSPTEMDATPTVLDARPHPAWSPDS
jgi:hypothetical protein